MELHQFRYFCAVAETGSFTKAASREHVSQPSLSQQIIKLEEEVGTALFIRLGHTTRLTPAGKSFLPKAKSILSQIGQATSAMQTVAKLESGSVTIGAIGTVGPYLLPQVLTAFKLKHPLVHLRVVEDHFLELLVLLRSAEVDMVLLQLPLRGKEFLTEELVRDPLCAALPDAHRLSNRNVVDLRDLTSDPFILLREGLGLRKTVSEALRLAKIKPNIVFEAFNVCTIAAMVAAGLGVAVVPNMTLEKRKGCNFIRLKGDAATRTVGLVRLRRNHQSPAQLLFAQDLIASVSRRN